MWNFSPPKLPLQDTSKGGFGSGTHRKTLEQSPEARWAGSEGSDKPTAMHPAAGQLDGCDFVSDSGSSVRRGSGIECAVAEREGLFAHFPERSTRALTAVHWEMRLAPPAQG